MKKLSEIKGPPSSLLSLVALVLLVIGVFLLAGTGWGIVASGIAAFVLEWRLTA